eukprot:CAMPEP_0194694052 /NCGR_PEP_ID=MMETSP0295-20121207/20990_1 /TAXON_ID=39354 /ORGANISM="Heterosigma akashiwo, Strain CCMP2393" /LENGTH=226 /DNA_ID=CAMNT_0039585237 /DNA_START=27 /DNA_END=707 /DNA_ORIENTATION=+
MASSLLRLVALALILSVATAVNVVATLRGTKYTVDATTVADVSAQIEAQASLAADQQAVLFKGKILDPEDDLAAAGVQDGDALNIVPNRRPKAARPAGEALPEAGAEATDAMAGCPGGVPSFEDMGIKEEEYEAMLDQMYDSDMFSQLFGDPEKLEETRQALISNPMMKQMFGSMPGFEEILNDPDAFREAMTTAQQEMKAQAEARKAARAAKSELTNEIDDLPEN